MKLIIRGRGPNGEHYPIHEWNLITNQPIYDETSAIVPLTDIFEKLLQLIGLAYIPGTHLEIYTKLSEESNKPINTTSSDGTINIST